MLTYATQTRALKDKLTPRKVWDKALEARRRIQNHFAPAWVRILNKGGGKFPSGQTVDDVLSFILDEEYEGEGREKQVQTS